MMKTFEEQYGVRIVQAWGMTETSPLATVARPLPGVPDDQQWGLRSSQGRLMCGVEGRIVDDDGNPPPHDGKAVGEVEVRGPWITGSRYITRTCDESKFDYGWLRTGDASGLGSDPFGYVTLTAPGQRARHQSPAASGSHRSSWRTTRSDIRRCWRPRCVAVPDERWQERPLAVRGRQRRRRSAAREELREFLGDKVVRWWLPRAVGVHRPGAADQRRQVRQ